MRGLSGQTLCIMEGGQRNWVVEAQADAQLHTKFSLGKVTAVDTTSQRVVTDAVNEP